MNKENGLTMVELLFTIAILVATVTSVLVLGNRAVAQTGLFTNHTQATFLAKEAMELLEDNSFRVQINEDPQSFWRIDYLKIEEAANQEECYQKLKTGSDGFIKIGESGDDETAFSRCIIATRNEDELKIEVDVAFRYQNNEHSINLYRVFYE